MSGDLCLVGPKVAMFGTLDEIQKSILMPISMDGFDLASGCPGLPLFRFLIVAYGPTDGNSGFCFLKTSLG